MALFEDGTIKINKEMDNATRAMLKRAKANERRILNPLPSFVLGALMGALIFIWIFGVEILDVTWEDWLLNNWYDLSQHYVGWKLYRASDWCFPIGMCNNSFYPYKMSVIYTDSIPLFSFIFKLLSPILPETFQFFGLYGLFSFMMQGGFAKLLLRRIYDKEWQCNLATIFFTMNIAFVDRMYYHTALGSHYVILAALVLILYSDVITDLKKRVVLWALLGFVCIGTHFTLYGIVSLMLLGYGLWVSCKEKGIGKRIFSFVLIVGTYLVVTVFTFYLFGGFYGGISGVSDGLGDYSANLNSFINPLGFSNIARELPTYSLQYGGEGLAYLGMSIFIFGFIGLPIFLQDFKSLWSRRKIEIILLVLFGTAFIVTALSPVITLGEEVICEIPVPEFIWNAWSIFRASGRFLWPVMYVFILLALYFSKKQLKTWVSLFLIMMVALHIYEFSDNTMRLQDRFYNGYMAEFSADYLDTCELPEFEHLQFMHGYYFGEFYGDEIRDQMIGYTQYALRHNMTVSNFHFSRDDEEKRDEQIELSLEQLMSGNPDPETLYVFKRDEFEDSGYEYIFENVKCLYTDTEVIVYSSNL